MNDEKIIEHINNEIFENVNNKEKKRNIIFSIIKRIIMNTRIYLDQQLIQKKNYQLCHIQQKNKTLNEIGIANGIYYPTTNIIQGILSEKDNYKVIIREKDENKYNAKKIISLRKIIYILKMQNIKIIFLICLLFAFSFYANEVKNTFVTKTSYIFR